MKKFLCLFLSLVMLIAFYILPTKTMMVSAATNPYPATQDVDRDGYYEVPCTYYAWQQVNQRLGISLPAWGNGGQWLNNAKSSGYSTGTTAKPNCLAVWQDSDYGHVAYVLSVSGSNMTICEGGRTDLDNTSSHGVSNSYTLSSTVGSTRSSGTQKLIGFIYLKPEPVSYKSVRLSTKNDLLNISWDAIPGATSYVVYVYTKSNCSEYAIKKEVSTTYLNNISVEPGRYWIYMHAINSAGASTGTGPFDYLTGPRNVIVSKRNDSINVTWDAVPGANCYDIIVTKPNGETVWLHSTENKKIINNCTNGNYSINVQSLYRPNGGSSTEGQIVGAHSREISFRLDYHECLFINFEDLNDGFPATCTQNGKTSSKRAKCKYCDATKTINGEVIIAKGHSGKTTTARATMSADGKIVKKCTVCGKTLSTTVIPKASSIKLSATSYTYDGKVKTPSVTVKDRTGKTLRKNTDYTVSYASGRKNVGKYAVKITFKGNYSGTKYLYFSVKPKNITIKTPSTGSKYVTAKWNKDSSVTGYQVMIATNSSFTKNKKVITIGKNSTTSYKFTKLKKGTKYYIKVRSYKNIKVDGKSAKMYSNYSSVKTIKCK